MVVWYFVIVVPLQVIQLYFALPWIVAMRKNCIISLLKDQVTLSLKEITQLRQKQSISAPPVTTDILHSDTLAHKFYSGGSSHFHLSQLCSSSESSLEMSAPSLSSGTTTLSSSSDTSAFSARHKQDIATYIKHLIKMTICHSTKVPHTHKILLFLQLPDKSRIH